MFADRPAVAARQRGLILAGASAGIAAAFNTPLAGMIFGIEEMSRAFESASSGLMIGGIIAAGLLGRRCWATTPISARPRATLHSAPAGSRCRSAAYGWPARRQCSAASWSRRRGAAGAHRRRIKRPSGDLRGGCGLAARLRMARADVSAPAMRR